MRVSLAVLACAVVSAGLPATAAAGIYMKIKDIPGESAQPDHQGWIEVQTWSLGPPHLARGPAGASAGDPAACTGFAGPGLVALRRTADKASPQLQRSAR